MLRALQRFLLAVLLPGLLLSGCTMDMLQSLQSPAPAPALAPVVEEPNLAPSFAGLDNLIARYAAINHVPESLIRRVIIRESGFNAAARHGPYLGLMQISYATARSMGYRGSPGGLLDAETNLHYAVKYLAGAYMVARGNPDRAVMFYARGYYYDARRMGLLDQTGLRVRRY